MKGLKVSELKQLIHNCTADDDEIVTKEDAERLFDTAGDDYELISYEDFEGNRYAELMLERENKVKKAALSFWANKKAGDSSK